MAGWYFDPQSGGQDIPPMVQEQIRDRLLRYVERSRPQRKWQLVIRFQKQFCYLDALEPDSAIPTYLCRLRYFGQERWSLAFYTYSNERYQPCVLNSGQWYGSVEEGFETSAVYLSS